MVEDQVKQWFEIVKESELDQIEVALANRPDWIQLRQAPLNHTTLFLVTKERQDQEGAAIVQMMLRRGANPNARNQLGQTAIFYAAAHNKLQVCRVILKNGVDVDLRDDFGQTARQYALGLGRLSIVLAIDQHIQSLKKTRHFPENFISQPQIQPKRQFTIPKLTYRLCKLTNTGRVITLTQQQMSELQMSKPQIMHLLRNPQITPQQRLVPAQNWRGLGLKIVDKLYELSDSFWFRCNSQIWKLDNMNPDIPGLDLQVIRLKLLHHMYAHPKELRIDMKNIWANCKVRLGVQHEMTRYALALCNHFEHLADKYAYNAYLKG